MKRRAGRTTERRVINHCTGERAYIALTNAVGDQVNLFPAGTTLALNREVVHI